MMEIGMHSTVREVHLGEVHVSVRLRFYSKWNWQPGPRQINCQKRD